MKADIYDDRIKRVATPFSHEYSDYNLQILFASVYYNFSSNLTFFWMQIRAQDNTWCALPRFDSYQTHHAAYEFKLHRFEKSTPIAA
jgi:hypothetical protein